MRDLDISTSFVVCWLRFLGHRGRPDAMEGGVINQGSNCWPVRLTAAVVRGNTKLRVRIDHETQCVCIEMDGTPCPILLGVTPSGAEALSKAISTGLAELASHQPSAEQATADTHD
jgi:hypothetical protein